MNFDLRAPCGNCPFRTDVQKNYGWLSEDRAAGIAESLEYSVFPCHKTTIHTEDGEYVENSKEQACYGAIAVMENEGKLFSNHMMQIAERFGLYQRHEVNAFLPVVRSRKQFIALHGDGHYSFAMQTIFNMTKAEKTALVSTYS